MDELSDGEPINSVDRIINETCTKCGERYGISFVCVLCGNGLLYGVRLFMLALLGS